MNKIEQQTAKKKDAPPPCQPTGKTQGWSVDKPGRWTGGVIIAYTLWIFWGSYCHKEGIPAGALGPVMEKSQEWPLNQQKIKSAHLLPKSSFHTQPTRKNNEVELHPIFVLKKHQQMIVFLGWTTYHPDWDCS